MIIGVMWGSRPIGRVAAGTVNVAHFTPVWDDFSGEDRVLDSDGRWYDCGPSTDYKAVVDHGKVRIGIPDNLVGPVERVSCMRYRVNSALGDDGHLEVRVVTRGDSTITTTGEKAYTTTVYAKMSTEITANNPINSSGLYEPSTAGLGDSLYDPDAPASKDHLYDPTSDPLASNAFSHGVGIRLGASRILLVVRRTNTDYAVADFGSYAEGDIIRLDFAGPKYTMWCEGRERGSWTDSKGIVATGKLNRGLGIRVHGAQESAGPRKFSPSLDYIEYG